MNEPAPNSPDTPRPVLTLRFKIGLILILLNSPFGYAGIALGVALHLKTRHAAWELLGMALYALSWGMLVVGVWMAGPEGNRQAQKFFRRLKERWFTRRS